jgi:hypothetical protein
MADALKPSPISKSALSPATERPGEDDKKDIPWYYTSPPQIPENMFDLLVNYSKIPREKVEQHVIDVVSIIITKPAHGSIHSNYSPAPPLRRYSNTLKTLIA